MVRNVDTFSEKSSRRDRSGDSPESRGERDVLSRKAAIKERIFQQEKNSLAPTPPEKEGFHRCWLTMDSYQNMDSIDQRLKLGYRLVTVEEAESEGFPVGISPSAGRYAGYCTFRELVMAEIPQEEFEVLMEIRHHDEPNRLARNRDYNMRALQQEVSQQTKTHGLRPTLGLEEDELPPPKTW